MSSGHDAERPRIVVGVDGFGPSKAALRWAIDQAKLTGAVVEAVTAWHIPVGTGGVAAADMPDYQADARAVLTESIADSGSIDSDVEIRCYVVDGRAGQGVLADRAERRRSWWAAGVAATKVTGRCWDQSPSSVRHYAPCPVVIMRGKH